jgi:hypothetical protein
MSWTRRRPPRLLAMGSNGLVSRVRTHSTPLGQARSPVRPVPRSRGHRAMRRRCRGAGPCRGRRRLPACARPPPARGSVITSSTRRRAIPSVSASPSRCVNADRPGCSDRAPNSAPLLQWCRVVAVMPSADGDIPELGASSPMITRIVVDFPAPLDPGKPVRIPAGQRTSGHPPPFFWRTPPRVCFVHVQHKDPCWPGSGRRPAGINLGFAQWLNRPGLVGALPGYCDGGPAARTRPVW